MSSLVSSLLLHGFEDQKQINEETGEETIIPAKEYWKIGHDGEDTPFITMASAEDTGVSAEIVDIDTGEVRMGKNALKLSYDFTNSANTTRVLILVQRIIMKYQVHLQQSVLGICA